MQGILGWDDQSQMISEAESPFSSTATSGLFKWFMYTAFNSSSREDANSGFGVFGGDLGLKKKKYIIIIVLQFLVTLSPHLGSRDYILTFCSSS